MLNELFCVIAYFKHKTELSMLIINILNQTFLHYCDHLKLKLYIINRIHIKHFSTLYSFDNNDINQNNSTL